LIVRGTADCFQRPRQFKFLIISRHDEGQHGWTVTALTNACICRLGEVGSNQ
jgi:hypothetical protein